MPAMPSEMNELKRFAFKALLNAVIERRKVIRAHRDAKGDDRCFLDDYLVWAMVQGLPRAPIPTPEWARENCSRFYALRNEDIPDPVPPYAITDPAKWDADLDRILRMHLLLELARIQVAIGKHFFASFTSKGFHSANDDRRLYKVLPEKMPADFRLPPREEFLGEALAPKAGCSAFWRSHQGCKKGACNLHQWGPCKGK